MKDGTLKEDPEIARKPLIASLARWAAFPLILLPAAAGFLYVRLFGVNVVFRDQWEMVSLFRNLSSGALSISELWGQHNDHRFVFPRLIMLALGTVTDWSNVAEMYLIQICLLVTLICLLLAFRDGTKLGWRLLLFVPVAFLVFSLRQYWNMLWGYQLTFAFTQMFGVLALYLLYLASHKKAAVKLTLPAALASATITSLSSIQGLLIWPAGLLLISITPMHKRTKRLFLGAWLLIGAAEWIAYFVGLKVGGGSSPLLYPLTHPIAGMEHFLTLLGGSLFSFQQRGFALISGVLLVALIAAGLYLARGSRGGGRPFWVALLCFALLMLASITVGRSGLGADNALASRYTTFSLLAVAAVYALLVKSALEERSRLAAASAAVLLAVVMLSTPLSYYQGIAAGSASRDLREEAARILLTYGSQPDERLEALNQRPQTVRVRAPILEELELNVFSDPERRSRSAGPG